MKSKNGVASETTRHSESFVFWVKKFGDYRQFWGITHFADDPIESQSTSFKFQVCIKLAGLFGMVDMLDMMRAWSRVCVESRVMSGDV